jgi:predicted ribosome quality control (RQC) complex YloA/Tae2 family protein
LQPEQLTTSLLPDHWEKLFFYWQRWMAIVETRDFQPGWTAAGYTVLGWGITKTAPSVQALLRDYYGQYLNQQQFQQIYQQISQKVGNALGKIKQKATTFANKLQESVGADSYRQQADLLMAHLHQVRSGDLSITLGDFITNEPVTIALNPEKNAVQNAQALYKQHQKLKRARLAVLPLLEALQPDIQYLEQVESTLLQLQNYQTLTDLDTLLEIRDELIQQGYLPPLPGKPDTKASAKSSKAEAPIDYHRYTTPNGFEVLIGRNNRQNDILSFRVAGDYDLWFHSQEIPGSHVLLRLPAGSSIDRLDLQFTADLAAYHSRAQHSEQVPIVYTAPKHVYKPKGAKPGMVIYKQEKIIWGYPQRVTQGTV